MRTASRARTAALLQRCLILLIKSFITVTSCTQITLVTGLVTDGSSIIENRTFVNRGGLKGKAAAGIPGRVHFVLLRKTIQFTSSCCEDSQKAGETLHPQNFSGPCLFNNDNPGTPGAFYIPPASPPASSLISSPMSPPMSVPMSSPISVPMSPMSPMSMSSVSTSSSTAGAVMTNSER